MGDPAERPTVEVAADTPKLPSVSGERVVRALERARFIELRQKGSHVLLEKRAGDQVFKTAKHSDLAKGTLSDISGIMAQCGLTLANFLDLL
jgi:predicted RNA binding protein YcfA (HicA-like mRNA interferase family)